ncbi:programmed cell death protein 2-like [Hippocampus zosterae]|uniref:programmed cell death protein 2-like n=1 Tax=Hippocampus zosterae TaxID=109293 RepID=UPI00223D289C|nr:programmed cell death protein 2-like [Hippocampus zosterae]
MSSPIRESTLLGVCDGELDDLTYPSSFLTNKVGGLPDVVPGLPRVFPRCECCSAPLVHMVQVYCPLEESPYHRSLQLFACQAAGCGGRQDSWTALRSQCLVHDGRAAQASGDPAPTKAAPLSVGDWCDSADDWGMDDDYEEEEKKDIHKPVPEDEKEDVMSSQLDALHLAEPPPDVPVLRPFFISVVDEEDARGEDNEEERSHAEQLLRDYERREGAVAVQPDDIGGGEKYEKSRAHHGDHHFSRFRKRISMCPQQILRYRRGGRPLFISEPPANERPAASACASCGGPLTFELQLMPALVNMLSWKDAAGDRSQPDFGTVLVYTCARSCWTSSERRPIREVCLVQMDPDHQLFK